jgi:ribosomal protein S18 acetylase RimI-like enzyme
LQINKFNFKALSLEKDIPYNLLLLADPSKSVIDAYLNKSMVFVMESNDEIIGVIVLLPLSKTEVEIKNVAVSPEHQGKGLGSFLIQNSEEEALKAGFLNIVIGTANSSIGQLALYQKLGFVINETKKNFFLENYSEAIFEDGIQAVDMIMLKKELE